MAKRAHVMSTMRRAARWAIERNSPPCVKPDDAARMIYDELRADGFKIVKMSAAEVRNRVVDQK